MITDYPAPSCPRCRKPQKLLFTSFYCDCPEKTILQKLGYVVVSSDWLNNSFASACDPQTPIIVFKKEDQGRWFLDKTLQALGPNTAILAIIDLSYEDNVLWSDYDRQVLYYVKNTCKVTII